MEFKIGKCAILLMKKRKRETMGGIELPHRENIRTQREKENYKYLGIFEVNIIKQTQMCCRANKNIDLANYFFYCSYE